MLIKVLVAGLVGTLVGIALMIGVIAIFGSDTEDSSSIGLGSLPISTATLSTAPSSTPTSGGGSSNPTSSGGGGDVSAGEAVFTANCASCHSNTAGTASPLPAAPNLAELAPNLTTAVILNQIANAAPPMPAGLVSGADADNVAAYILSLGQ
jgi:cytochrome c551